MLKQFVSAKLGRCSKCFRASLFGAVLGWLAIVPTFAFIPNPECWIVLIWPVSFTALWVLHMLTFAQRSVVQRAVPNWNRRHALAAFGSALTVAILASLPHSANAAQCSECFRLPPKERRECCNCQYEVCHDNCKEHYPKDMFRCLQHCESRRSSCLPKPPPR
jgi:hypothetical protein